MVSPIRPNIMLLIIIIDCYFFSHGVKRESRIPGGVFLWSTVIRVRSLTRSPEYTLRFSSGSLQAHVLLFIFANLSPTGYYAFSWIRAENAALSSYFYTLSDNHVRWKNFSKKHIRAVLDNKVDNVPRV